MSSDNESPSATSAPAAAPTVLKEPTPKEGLFFYHILASNTGKLEVDWDVVASKAGYSNGATAKVRYGQIRRSLLVPADGSAPAKTPTKPRAKKAKGDDGAPGSGTNTTPSKVKKAATPRKKRPTAAEKRALEAAAAAQTEAPAAEEENSGEDEEMEG